MTEAAAAPAIRALEALVFRAPVAVPVETAFGIMHDRPMVLVRVEDAEGATGWGEIWCNFPTCGAEHRARLLRSALAPLLLGRDPADPAALWREMTARTRILALQTGEPGPLAQCLAGIDIALWDLRARRLGRPLHHLLGGDGPGRVPVYASGLNPTGPERLAAARRAEGYRAFKLKVGFGLARDLRNVAALCDAIGPGCALMVDANQGWAPAQAREAVAALAAHDLGWIEEPLAADTPWPEWQSLADAAAAPLAGGENLAGEAAFATAIAARALGVVQPDLAKWGGFSGCLPVARQVRAAGLRYCPHFLGGGIGLLASAHLLAGVGGDGMLEVDANGNPLRTLLAPDLAPDLDGQATLPEGPGLGTTPDLGALRAFAAG